MGKCLHFLCLACTLVPIMMFMYYYLEDITPLTQDIYDSHFNARADTDIPENKRAREYLAAIQNPVDCASARKLVCPMRRVIGFVSTFHEVVTCFMYAALTNRTVMLSHEPGDVFTRTEWEEYFLPISTSCREWAEPAVEWAPDHKEHQVVKISAWAPQSGILPHWKSAPPQWIPAPSGLQYPISWWAGHVVAYLFRLQPVMQQHVKEAREKLGFVAPLPGMQVRRTDKRHEAKYVNVERYMDAVKRYYDNKPNGTEKRVYVATDEPNIVTEFQTKFPDYNFLFDLDTINIAKTPGSNRSRPIAHIGIITDIQLLLDCEFVVCTLSSNICRLVFEYINSKMMNSPQTFESADVGYRYW